MVEKVKKPLSEILEESRALRREAEEYLQVKGVKYSLSEWVTIKEYTKRFSLDSTSVVSNWIARGIIPSDNVITVEELNNLKLIRAISYKD